MNCFNMDSNDQTINHIRACYVTSMAMPCFIFIMSLLHFFSMAEKCAEFFPSRGVEQFTAPYSTPWGGKCSGTFSIRVGQKSFCAGFFPSSGVENVPDFFHPVGATVNVTVKSMVKKKYTPERPEGTSALNDEEKRLVKAKFKFVGSKAPSNVVLNLVHLNLNVANANVLAPN